MSRLARLKAAASLSDVAELLHFRPKAVSYILYKQPAATKYRTFQIPKRNGGQRTIKAPFDALKLLQRNLADLLQDCVDEINTANKRKDRTAHGFKRRRSIITNARQHRHRRWVFNLDLEDFFPSINFGRVRGFLLKSRDFELHEKVATVIAQIACCEGSLPQGSPCSPVISNLVAHLLDMRLVRLASSAGCTYSRYADDLTFSTNRREFPSDIAVSAGTESVASHLWLPTKTVQQAVERAGFRINPTKTHMMYRASRQEVTGLVTNVKVNVRRDYRRNVRAMVHRLVKTGGFQITGVTERDGQSVLEMRSGTLRELHGMLGFIDSIQVYNRTQTSDYLSDEMSSSEKAYRTFLMYTTFYAAEAPVVICEGETDNVYLTHAIRSLATDFPDLAEVMPDKTIRLRVRLFKYVRSSTARLLQLNDGGSGLLSKFIARYKTETSAFTGPGMTNPVIVLYDNDSGGASIRKVIENVYEVVHTDAAPFVHVVKNMYAVHTPGKAPSKIEDLFDATAKGIVVEGKTFHDGKGSDADKHYGKKVFAHKVVRSKADTLDFTGFRPLLANLVAAINKHRASLTPSVDAQIVDRSGGTARLAKNASG
jgi:RNA-directed DNA polymerase